MRAERLLSMWGYLDPLPPILRVARATWLVLRGGVIAVCLVAASSLVATVAGALLDARTARIADAACLLYQATQTATGLLMAGNPGAAAPTHRYWSEAEAGRQALTEARVECR